ncbi:predicted protein [Streptomyces viridochromogenes DSM 40736]|uniref:Predicted protein n=1 Tax=Streptomyces viridochromogenes (strain DSM 40736 / JCM 4977 / BCRC 1201 / Tue 494) TaxID=591159 RepID=D9X8G7_STRVT|nr:peptidoglycan-binding domain-containing protein [Streptomyces viridochromogenes]EFL34205.1 predicted protein [Streptomyces viridochromogenes DSM 40736]
MRKVLGTFLALPLVAGATLVGLHAEASTASAIDAAAASSTTSVDLDRECPANIGQGNAGPCVADVQSKLNQLGANPQLDVDGIAGRQTYQAVITFQRSHGLTADGVVGPLTKQAISDALSGPPAPPATAPAPSWTVERGWFTDTYYYSRTMTRQIADEIIIRKQLMKAQERTECTIAGKATSRIPVAGQFIQLGSSRMCKNMSKWAANDFAAHAEQAAAQNACLVSKDWSFSPRGLIQGGHAYSIERGDKCWD